jgi:hypothetical protein
MHYYPKLGLKGTTIGRPSFILMVELILLATKTRSHKNGQSIGFISITFKSMVLFPRSPSGDNHFTFAVVDSCCTGREILQ